MWLLVAPGRSGSTWTKKRFETHRPNEAWLAVQKDLLDQQIIDISGRKVVRVNDIDLAGQRAMGSSNCASRKWTLAYRRIRSCCRGWCPRRYPTDPEKLPARLIPWEFVNLIERPAAARKLRIHTPEAEGLTRPIG